MISDYLAERFEVGAAGGAARGNGSPHYGELLALGTIQVAITQAFQRLLA